VTQRLLLDTHILLWSLSAPGRIPAAVRNDIANANSFVSAATIWEIAIKFSTGSARNNPMLVLNELPVIGFELLPVTGLHAARTADLNALRHKDPFDRLLVAQAICESMVLITNDEGLRFYAPSVRLI
jgi:PIN domain nuclease of toxin-antitoxin system